jgi:hypothetical protein
MKKTVLIILLICAICAFAYSQEIVYVSANGNDNNSGLREAEALKTLSAALSRAEQLSNGRITVIGTLDANSETQSNRNFVFVLSSNSSREILITGKRNASGSERAVLSAKDSNKSVVSVSRGSIRFENIEISNARGEGTGAVGVLVNSRMTLGQGAVVKDNNTFGILIYDDNAICTINGGEVRNNNSSGVYASKGLLVLQGGTISDNSADMGAGVLVAENAKFEMRGGTISNNKAEWGAGVVVMNKGAFNMSDGTITRNTANDSVGGVWIQPGGIFDRNLLRAKISGNTSIKKNINPNIFKQ